MPFSPLTALRILGGVAVLLAIAWVVRIDSLRGSHRDNLMTVQKTVQTKTGDKKVLAFDKLSTGIVRIADERDAAIKRYQQDEIMIAQQNLAIEELGAETQRLRALSTEAQAKVRRLTAERQKWIDKAAAASTRMERGTAEQEAEECSRALDDVYHSGF